MATLHPIASKLQGPPGNQVISPIRLCHTLEGNDTSDQDGFFIGRGPPPLDLTKRHRGRSILFSNMVTGAAMTASPCPDEKGSL